MTTGQLIRTARKKVGLTQKELGEKLNISYVNISQLENDQRSPGLDTLQRIAAALGVDPYSLYSFDQATEALEQRISARERVEATMEQLSPEGQVKVADYAEDILPRYQAQTPKREGQE